MVKEMLNNVTYCATTESICIFLLCVYFVSGAYCPEGTHSPFQFECPAGTFNNRTLGNNAFDCLPCPGRWRNSSI